MNLMQYIKGSVRIKLAGNMPEKFLNICNANSICIYDIENIDGDYYCRILPSDYKKLLPVVYKTSVMPCIIEKYGLPFFIFSHRKHQCFVVGVMLSFFILYLLSLFVWDISFDGNTRYSDDVLVDFLATVDIIPGMMIKKTDCDYIEKNIRKSFDDITWVSAEISGTRLIVHIKENDEDVIEKRSNEPHDIVAAKSGTVYSIVTRTGTPLVAAGDEVKEGDILVSADVYTYDDYGTIISSKQVAADADILLSTVYEYNNYLPKKYEYKIYTGKKASVGYIEINGKVINAGFVPDYEAYTNVSKDRQLRLTRNFLLPVHYGKREYMEYYTETNEYTINEANVILNDRLEIFLQNLRQKGVQIIENNVKINVNAAVYSFAGEISVIEAAVTQSEPVRNEEGTLKDERD